LFTHIIIIFLFISLISFLGATGCENRHEKAVFENIRAVDALKEHTKEFNQRVVKVTGGVYVAIGYGLANSILLEGDDGVIIIDTMECVETAREVSKAFGQITQKPVKAVIYTHNHADHVFGASMFATDPSIPVYAHESTSGYIDRVISILRPILTRRSMRMFGNFLDDTGLVNAGIGARLNLKPDSTIGIVRPTKTFSDEMTDEVAGIRFKLIHVPGETNDQILVWLPDKKVLLPGDNIYKTFPNLYTIRGTMYRDVKQWVNSLDIMRALRAEFLVPCHTGPISGADNIYRVLTDYRDGIAYVHDQTIRGINLGLTPDELVETIRLPEHLANSPYLKEFYGTVAWSVRSIFDGNLGWFDGNPSQLFPLSPDNRAQQIAKLTGGINELQLKAEQAFNEENFQWALELTDFLMRLTPNSKSAADLRVKALIALGERQSNPNARHYYLTCAAELGQGLTIHQQGKPTPEMIHSLPMSGFFDSLAVNLDPEKSKDLEQTVQFIFPDSNENYFVQIRRGATEIQPERLKNPDITVTVDSKIFKEMLGKLRNPITTIATEFNIDGGKVAFLQFMAMFDPAYEE
jgi:alkyl sulfatase BDS1-like metallo-beta-lactamase superfamily hydrolase